MAYNHKFVVGEKIRNPCNRPGRVMDVRSKGPIQTIYILLEGDQSGKLLPYRPGQLKLGWTGV